MMVPHETYRFVKPKGSKTGDFVNVADPEALAACRAHCGNRDLQISAADWKKPDLSSPSRPWLYWRVTSYSIDLVRQVGLGILDYVPEHSAVPEPFIEVRYDGGGSSISKDTTGPSPGGRRSGLDGTGALTPAEIAVIVPPTVFDPPPTPLIPLINYRFARQMRENGIAVDIDIYAKDQQFLPLLNSINSVTGGHVISVSKRELLYLDGAGLLELSRQLRSDESAEDRHVPEAAVWFAQTLQEEESRQKWQSQLRQTLWKTGWQVPPCVRRLHWADLSEDEALEACRVIAGFYPFINAGEEEVWHHILQLERRHGIREPARLRFIIAFGSENPGFLGCNHPLLQKFCPATKCRFEDIYNDYVNPRLFT